MDTLPPHIASVLARAVPGADPASARVIGEGWGATAYRLGDRTVRVLKPQAYAASEGTRANPRWPSSPTAASARPPTPRRAVIGVGTTSGRAPPTLARVGDRRTVPTDEARALA